jgi:alpha-beta hydrolase superfamily lysophospholipase
VYLDYIRKDPLRLTSATVRFFWQSRRLDRFIDRNIESNALPVQLFLADGDPIIDNTGVLNLLQRGREPGLDVLEYSDQRHSIQMDASERLVHDMIDWLRRRGAARVSALSAG